MSINRVTHLTPHEMITGRPMPVTYLRGPTRGPNLEQLQKELQEYVKCLTKIHREIFTQVKGTTEGRTSNIADESLKEVLSGDYVYIKPFKRLWTEPRREGPFEVILATPTAIKKPLFSQRALRSEQGSVWDTARPPGLRTDSASPIEQLRVAELLQRLCNSNKGGFHEKVQRGGFAGLRLQYEGGKSPKRRFERRFRPSGSDDEQLSRQRVPYAAEALWCLEQKTEPSRAKHRALSGPRAPLFFSPRGEIAEQNAAIARKQRRCGASSGVVFLLGAAALSALRSRRSPSGWGAVSGGKSPGRSAGREEGGVSRAAREFREVFEYQ
ncbi:hypothetical protein AOLI_G00199200 [Acnodon oligacanthus]